MTPKDIGKLEEAFKQQNRVNNAVIEALEDLVKVTKYLNDRVKALEDKVG